MKSERLSRLLNALHLERPIRSFGALANYIRSLPPSDKLIVGILSTLVLVSSVVSLFAFIRTQLVEVPTYGGTLTEGVVGTPRFINPLLALTDADRDMTALTFAGLMGVGPDGTLVPVLAESYEVSPDGKVYTFTLRDNATFSDGAPVTATDVVFTVEKAKDPGLKSPEFSNWARITAEAVDARTVRFTLPKPYAPFLADTTLGILPSHLWRNVANDKFPFSPLMQKPVGAGPFKVAKVTTNSDGTITGIELKSHAGFAPGKAYLSAIHVRFYENLVQLQGAYKAGRIESAYGIATENSMRAPYARVFGVFFNKKENAALGRIEVRKALSIAIDRATITGTVLGGSATPLIGPVPPGGGITAPVLPDPATRIADASALLKKNGWEYDEELGTWKNAKAKLQLDTITIRTSNVPELKAVASSIQTDWQTLGVPTAIELFEPGDLAQDVIRPRAYSALLFGMVVGREQDLYAFWDSSEQADPGLNIASYANTTVDALLEKARSESDPEKARGYIQDASDKIAADYPAAFTHAPEFLYAVPKNLYGVVLPQIASPADRFATVASWYKERAYVWPFLVRSH